MTGSLQNNAVEDVRKAPPLSVTTSAADWHSHGDDLPVFDRTSLTPCLNKAFVSAKSRANTRNVRVKSMAVSVALATLRT
jgi:hypothetical protein